MWIISNIFRLLLIPQIFAKDDLSLWRGNGNINQDRRSLQKEVTRCGTHDLSPEERKKVDPAVKAWIKEQNPVKLSSQEKIQIQTGEFDRILSFCILYDGIYICFLLTCAFSSLSHYRFTVFHIIKGTNGAGALTIKNVEDSF